MGTSGGPAGSGPTTSSRTVTLTENGTSTFTPTVTATYSLSNQQYPSGTVNGTSQVGLTFGGSTNNGGSMGSWPYYPLMNNIGSANNTMFSACSTCGANSGINVSSDKAISLFTSANALITSSSTNKVALNARVYFGDLTITFNRPVTNPVLHFIGMGAFYEHSGNSSDKVYFQGFSAEFDLASSGMSLSKLDGSTYFTVASNQIRNTASQLSYSSVGVVQYGVSRHGASGSVLVTGTNITTIKLRVYLRGDGGRISTTSGATTSASSGQYVAWSNAASNPFAAGGASHSGDVFLVGASLAAPIEDCTNNIDDDWDGLVDCDDPDCKLGVGKQPELWLKANNGVAATNVSSWLDQSGNNRHASQSTSTNQPILVDNAMNYNPTIRFDGASDFLNTPLSINYNTMPDATIITIYKPDKNSAGAVWGEDNAGWDRFLLDGNTTTLNNMVSEGGGSNLNINQLFNTAEVHLTSVVYDQGASNGSLVYVNGVNQRTFTASQTTASSLFQIGAIGSNSYPFDGDIGEVFVYNSILSATERQKVESYLAIKYGITLSNNYFASDGTSFWNINGTYSEDIAGIGRDDCAELHQKQSKSSNTTGLIEMYHGDVTNAFPITNAANTNDLTDATFLAWANDGGSISSYSTNIYGDNTSRIGRVWQVQETGTVGTVTLRILKSTLPAADNYNLYINTANNTSFPNDGSSQKIELTDDGTYLYTTVNFSDGDLFTFAKPIIDLAYCPHYEWTSGIPPASGQGVYAWNSVYENGNISGTLQVFGATAGGFPQYIEGAGIGANFRTNANVVVITFDEPVTNFSFMLADVDVMDDQRISAVLNGVNVDLVQGSTYSILHNYDHTATDVVNGDFDVLDATPSNLNNTPATIGFQVSTPIDQLYISTIDGGTGNVVVAFGCTHDWGDAADSYATDSDTTNGNGGDNGNQLGANSHITDYARYGTIGNTYLNTFPDIELTGLPSITSLGDDTNAGDDETANLSTLIEGSSTYSTAVTVYNSLPIQSYVIGWLDWNNNGIFEISEASNKVTVAANSIDDGTVKTLTWNGLSGIVSPNQYNLRLRISSDVNLNSSSYFGLHDMGEVEDYQIIAQLDSDNDGIVDADDIDDDNDGILDTDEIEIDCSCTDWTSGTTGIVTVNGTDINITASGANLGQTEIGPASFGGCTEFLDLEPSNSNGGSAQQSGSSITFDFSPNISNPTFSIKSLGFTGNFEGTLVFTDGSGDPVPIDNVIGSSAYSINNNSISGQSGMAWDGVISLLEGSYSQVNVMYITSNGSSDGVFYSIQSCVEKDTDMDGLVDRLDLDSDGDGCYDKAEANVTGFTTNGSITDSLAASTAAEVGANGLDNDLENNDTQAATTAGSYTITQTNSGTNDFQDPNILNCIEICNDNMDNDGDGFVDCADSDCKPIISSVTTIQPTCANKTGGQITITATGSGTLSYSIKNEPTYQTSNIFSNLGTGQYTIRVKNDAGCITEYSSNPIVLDLDICIEICDDGIDNDGDGLIDCDDPDCGNFGTVNQINN